MAYYKGISLVSVFSTALNRKLINYYLLQELKKCFDAQDVPLLQATIAKMPEQEAIYYMKKCVDAGLWVPGKNDDEPTMKENAGESSQASESSAKPSESSTKPSESSAKPSVSIDDVD